MVSAPQRRQAVVFLKDRRLSERRACDLVGIGRSSCRYQAHPRDDSQLVERLKAIARKYRRYGYRRAWWVLHCEGQLVNPKRVYRLWRQAGLCLPRRRRRKSRRPEGLLPCVAEHPNHVWTCDFIHDACSNGRQLKILTVTDEFTRESLAVEPAHRLHSGGVLQVLERLVREHGAPQFLRSDNGPEFIARCVRRWVAARGLQTIYIDPGSPWQNGFAESFHSKLRDECLSMEVFASLAEAGVIMQAWRNYYNQQRPHSSLGYLTPLQFKAAWHQQHRQNQELDQPPSLSLLGPPESGPEKEAESRACLMATRPCPSPYGHPPRRSGRTAELRSALRCPVLRAGRQDSIMSTKKRTTTLCTRRPRKGDSDISNGPHNGGRAPPPGSHPPARSASSCRLQW